MDHGAWLKDVLVFLAAAGLVVPLFHRARIGAVLGFLCVGIAVGPYGFGQLAADFPWLRYLTIEDRGRAEPFAELGVLFLLFLIGLELSLARLWSLRRYVAGIGALQFAFSALAVETILPIVSLPPPGGNGTTSLIARAGYVSAPHEPPETTPAIRSPARMLAASLRRGATRVFIDCLPSSSVALNALDRRKVAVLFAASIIHHPDVWPRLIDETCTPILSENAGVVDGDDFFEFLAAVDLADTLDGAQLVGVRRA